MSNNATNSISFFSLLGLSFIILKLTNYINWSWWLVLLPLYGLPVVVISLWLACVLAIVACGALSVTYKHFKGPKKAPSYVPKAEVFR
jgi:hypothetical protein